MEQGSRQAVKQHPAALRQKVLALCAQPGASVSKIAQAHGLSASLIYGWRQLQSKGAAVAGSGVDAPQAGPFIALPVVSPRTSVAAQEIRIELRRGDVTIDITWPIAAAELCGVWLDRRLA